MRASRFVRFLKPDGLCPVSLQSLFQMAYKHHFISMLAIWNAD